MKKYIFPMLFGAILSVSCKKTSTTTTESPAYPTDGLISYFNFNDNLKDSLGNTPDGYNHGGAVFVSGVKGKAISLNGADQYIEFARQTYNSDNKISVSLWFQTNQAGLSYIVKCSDFGVYKNGSGATTGMVITTPLAGAAYGNYTPLTWTHLVGTYDGTDIKAYINGTLVNTFNYPGPIVGTPANLIVGYYNTKYFEGNVDELFIYDRVLTRAEVTQLYYAH